MRERQREREKKIWIWADEDTTQQTHTHTSCQIQKKNIKIHSIQFWPLSASEEVLADKKKDFLQDSSGVKKNLFEKTGQQKYNNLKRDRGFLVEIRERTHVRRERTYKTYIAPLPAPSSNTLIANNTQQVSHTSTIRTYVLAQWSYDVCNCRRTS